MNKAQLIEELSSRFEGNKKQAQHALESIIDVIQRSLVKGEKVAITGFGAFEKIDRPARTARNPKTGASVKVKKTSVPKFRAGSDLKAVVSGAKKLPKLGTAKKAGPAPAAGARKTAAAANGGAPAAKRTTKAADKTTTTRPATKAASGTASGSTAKKASEGTATRSTAKKATTTTAKKTAARTTAKKTASR